MRVSTIITSIASLIAVLPGVSQLLKIDLLPHYWNNELFAIAASALCFVSVGILYSIKDFIAALARRKVIKISIVLFVAFLISIITFSVLSNYCLIQDYNYASELKDREKDKVFIPLLLSESLNDKIANPIIGTRKIWVELDGKPGVEEQLMNSPNIEIFYGLTMIIFIILYLLIFLFLICSFLILGFYLAPKFEMEKSM